MSRRALLWLGSAVLTAMLLASAVWMLVATSTGLRLVAWALVARTPGALQLQVGAGSLSEGFTVHHLGWQSAELALEAEEVKFRLDLVPLLAGGLILESVEADSARVGLRGASGWPARVPVLPRLPLAVELRDLRLERLVVEEKGRDARTFERLQASGILPVSGPALLDGSVRMAGLDATVFARWGEVAPDGLDLEFHWQAVAVGLPPAQGSGRVWGQGASLQVTHQLVAPMQVELEGRLQLAGAGPHWTARVTLPAGQRPAWLAGSSAPALPTLRFDLAGSSFSAWDIAAKAPCDFVGLAGVQCQLMAIGTPNDLTVRSLVLSKGDSRVAASGRVWWPQGRPHWQLAAQVQRFDPALAWPAASGELDFLLAGEGEALTGSLKLSELSGTLHGHAVNGEASARLQEGALAEANAELRAGRALLSLASQPDHPGAVQWRLEIPALETLLPTARGRLHGEGRWQGRAGATASSRGALEGTHLALAGHAAGELSLRWDLDAREPGSRQSITLSAHKVRLFDLPLSTLQGAVRGTREKQHLEASLQAGSGSLALAAVGGPEATGGWRGSLVEGQWQAVTGTRLALAAPAAIEANFQRGSITTACWVGRGELCLDAEVRSGQDWQARARASDFDLGAFGSSFLPRASGAAPRLEGRLTMTGQAASLSAWDGRLQVALPAALLPREAALELAPVAIELRTSENALELALATQVEAPVALPLTLRLATPRHALLPAWSQWPLQGSLRGRLASLAALAEQTDDLAEVEGQAMLDLLVRGTVDAPVFAGGATLEVAHAHFTRFGTAVTDLQISARGQQDGRLALSGQFMAGEGKVDVSGTLGADERGPAADLLLEGQQVRFIDLPEASALASGRLRLRLAPGHASVEGDIAVPEASVKLRERAAATRRSADVVVEDGGVQEASMPPVDIALALTLGKAVVLEAGGFSGRLAGKLALAATRREPLQATGTLDIEDGRYEQWGEMLSLRASRLLFDHQPLTDPSVDARAERQIGSVTAGLRVTGRLREPDGKLYSSPALPEVDVLSYLIAGQPLSGASSADARNLLGAAASMGLRGSGLLSQKVASAFGLDTLQVGTRSTPRGPALDVGKFISPQLYVGYGAGLLERANTFRLRYLLGKRWSIEAETGSRSGADLLYSIER